MTDKMKENLKDYDCPYCSVAVNLIPEGDGGPHWLCPTCGHHFYDEKALMSQMGIKPKDKKE